MSKFKLVIFHSHDLPTCDFCISRVLGIHL